MLRLVRKIFSDKSDDFTFYRYNKSKNIDLKSNTGLYIHIPFCTHFCPYCPYFKVRYNKDVAQEYKKALLKEIELYYKLVGKQKFSSIYIGGGTPTLMLNEIEDIIGHIHRYFSIDGSYGIETNPNDINKKISSKLKSLGFNLISQGIQSFNDQLLKKIGRDYNSNIAIQALKNVIDEHFDTINIDLIFAIENQTIEDIKNDLTIAINQHIDQITCYPLFTFPYSEIGELKKLKKIKLPNNHLRKKMYYFINDFLKDNGYEKTTVWSFNKNRKETYSSVTRDYYLGLGAGAGSYNGSIFYFNTFSVSEYINSVNKILPISINMNVSKKLEKVFWLYWRLYETTIVKNIYKEMFHSNLGKDFGSILKLIRILGFVEYEDENILKLNTKGSHWIHLVQNYYALNYVSKVWSVSKNNPWPDQIKL